MPWPTVLALALAGGALALYARERRARSRAEARADAADRRRAQDALRMERGRQAALDRVDALERRFRLVARAAPDAMLLVAADGRVAAANPAAARLLGTPEDALEGLAVRDLARDGHAVRRDGRRVPVEATRDAWKEGGEAWSVVWLREARPPPAPHEGARAPRRARRPHPLPGAPRVEIPRGPGRPI